jgi:hypothetical protein
VLVLVRVIRVDFGASWCNISGYVCSGDGGIGGVKEPKW